MTTIGEEQTPHESIPMEAKRRTARSLVSRLRSAPGDASLASAVAEIRLLSKQDPDARILLIDAGAVPVLSHLIYPRTTSSPVDLQENAAAALLNLSISCREALMSTPGLLDSLNLALRSPSPPIVSQHAAATLYSLLTVEAYRPIIGAKRDLLGALIALLRQPGAAPARFIKDALKALFGVALYPLNRSVLIELGAAPALFSLLVADSRAGVVEDATAVVAQVAGCYESLEAFKSTAGVVVLVDLLDKRNGSSEKARANAVSALVNLALSGGERAVADILKLETAEAVVREMAEEGSSERAKNKAGALLALLLNSQRRERQLPQLEQNLLLLGINLDSYMSTCSSSSSPPSSSTSVNS